MREVASFAELKELRLRVMELETQTQLALNQLKRQTATVAGLNTEVDTKNRRIREQQVGTQSFHNIQKMNHQKPPPNRFLNVKAPLGAFNKKKASLCREYRCQS